MDPVATLQRMRELAAAILAGIPDLAELERAADELAELVHALDEWRRAGGFDPWEVIA